MHTPIIRSTDNPIVYVVDDDPENALLPSKRSYYRYEGSLTTPPCTENVEWLVLTEPIQAAEADINSFARSTPRLRPVQKDNRRFVLRSS